MDLSQVLLNISPWNEGRCLDFMLYLTPMMDDRWWSLVYGSGLHDQSLVLIDGQTGQSETIVKDSILNTCMLDEQYLIVRMKQSMFIYELQ